MADIIKLLPDSVANQIAAGEVIQRPASVVNELTEIAVDAGSTVINVVIKDSGKTLIQVIDNGSGMSETDARLSFERHATSKITCAQDLFAISTKGFRGEALASIAAVAMVELKTRRSCDETGTRIVISGSKIETQEPCSTPIGSIFSVKNLFFNIPARRKFLKSEATELRHIINEFQKICLSHPEIKFTFTHNDNEVYNLPAGNLRQRIIGLFGKQINQELLKIETETTLVNISGFICKPEGARKTYGEQFFFANKRFMKHPYFHKAVTEAYQNLLPADAIPSYFIYLETDPANIDINIHPTKTEIKFENERAIWQLLMAAVRESLGRFNSTPSIDFDVDVPFDMPIISIQDKISAPPKIKIDPDYNPFKSNSTYNRDSFIDVFEKENLHHWQELYPENDNKNLESNTDNIAEPTRKIFQIRNKYIVSPVKSGVMFIDQRRAHERILYEKFMDMLKNNISTSQSCMFPIEITLNPADYLVVKDLDNSLKTIGFIISFDDTHSAISISGYPSVITSSDIQETMEILIEEFKSTNVDYSEKINEKIATAMAAAAAIPYGKALSAQELENIFDSLFACASPNYTPKGKMITLIVPIEDLDKRFQ